MTDEGIKALNECITVLENTEPVLPLLPAKGLVLSARDQAVDQGKTGQIGHNGSDNSSPEGRMDRYGQFDLSCGENIDYGNDNARRIVFSLVVDDGVSSRGHRTNLLNGNFKYIGVSVGPHPQYGTMCVMDFASEYTSK